MPLSRLRATLVVIVGTVVALVGLAVPAWAGTPVPVTPYSGASSTLTRAPYVTDLTQTSAYVTWATSSGTPGSIRVLPFQGGSCPSTTVTTWTSPSSSSSVKPVPTSLPGPVNPTSTATSSSMTGWAFSVTNGAGTTKSEYQASVLLSGLSAGTTYCYAVFSTNTSAAVDLLPAAKPYQTFRTLDPASTSSQATTTFAVIGDTGENYSNSGALFPGAVNPDEAAIYKLIGSSGAQFLLNAGDIAYDGGTQSNYGDLQQTGTTPEVSTIFGPSYYPQTGGIPTFTAVGNHGQNVNTLKIWPTPKTATNSGGTYSFDSYSGVDGISGTFPDDWYAFSTANVRIYVLDGAWADGSSAATGYGTASGSLCPGNETNCKGYQADYDEHWQTTRPEYKWLASDLAAHPGGAKFAVFHYPLRSDSATQPADPYLQNTTANPNASTSLEKLLSANGVAMAFNGHAHTYQRFIPTQSGTIPNYVTGGGGGVLSPVLGGITCTNLQGTASVYALGWNPSTGAGSSCGAAKPTSAADVHHFLKVTVSGTTVTVAPTSAAGTTFDVQTYHLGTTTPPPSAPDTTITSAPPATTTATTASLSFTSTGSAATFTCRLDGGTASSCTSPKTYSGLGAGSHTFSVASTASGVTDPTPATASWTVQSSTTPPPASSPAFVQAASATGSTASTTVTATLPKASTAGDLLVVSASEYAGATNNIRSVTDNAGNTWTRINAWNVSGHNSDGELWYSRTATPASTVTVTTGSAAYVAFTVQEFSGFTALDTSAGASNTGTTATSGTATAAAAGELVVGFVAGHGSAQAMTLGAGYTARPQVSTSGSVASLVAGYQLPGSASPSISATFPSAMYWSAGVAVFK
jgi:Calcineurin-like phosphoesterase